VVPRVRIELTTRRSSKRYLDYIIIPINREAGAYAGLLFGSPASLYTFLGIPFARIRPRLGSGLSQLLVGVFTEFTRYSISVTG
jgi:hypothetical protein